MAFIAEALVHRWRCAPRPWRGSGVAIGQGGGAGGLTSCYRGTVASWVTPGRLLGAGELEFMVGPGVSDVFDEMSTPRLSSGWLAWLPRE